LIGIARRTVDGRRYTPAQASPADFEQASPHDLEASALERLTLAGAVSTLDDRSRELIALRYGADLSARQIGAVLGLKTNAVEVSLHRALARVRAELEKQDRSEADVPLRDPATRASS
jgi:RNA polymerase sigma factor (sigma-70 family)